MPCMRPDCTRRVFSTKLSIIVHNFTLQLFDQLLPDHAILAACYLGDRFRDGINHFIGFIGIDIVVTRQPSGMFGKEIIDQINHQAMEAGRFWFTYSSDIILPFPASDV